jgi:SAM-dependent methyltransferase
MSRPSPSDLEWLPACPLCGRVRFAPFETWDAAGQALEYVICRHCGLVFRNPQPTAAALQEYYASEYVRDHQGADSVTEREVRVQQARAAHLIGILQASVAGLHRHLDIGCSTGTLMRATAQAYGCQTVGIEPARVYRQAALSQDLLVYSGLAEMSGEHPGRFDLISLSHVLEHLSQPLTYLEGLRREWLAPEGWLLIEVPNLMVHQALEFPHLLAFDRRSLEHALMAAGFRPVLLRGHGMPRSRRFPLYLLALAQGDETATGRRIPSRPAALIKLRRRAGRMLYTVAARLIARAQGKDYRRGPDREDLTYLERWERGAIKGRGEGPRA